MKVKQKTEVVPAGQTLPALPAKWEVQLAEAAKDETVKEVPSVQAFSLRAGVLSYNGQPMPGNKMNVVILASAFESALFINKFDPGNIISPLCFALSETGEDMAPHDNSFKPQGGDEHVCLGCEHAEWGSDQNSPSGRGKSCKETRRLAVMPEDGLADIGKAQIAMLRVPVTSVANWASYVHMLAATAKRPAWSVVTEIKVVPDPKKQFQVMFAPADAVNDSKQLEELQAARTRAVQAVLNPYGMMTEEQYKEITAPAAPAKKKKF